MVNRKLISRPPLTASTFSSLRPDRFDKVHLYEHISNINNDSSEDSNWRYELTIIDRNLNMKTTPGASSMLPCAVFLIPAGRESEYVFRTKNGLMNVAESANCVRLIAVSFHRNHVYVNQEFVQQELERTVQLIAQKGSFWRKDRNDEYYGNDLKIPFLAVDGIGKRNVIGEGETPTTGPFVVEEVKDPDGDENSFVRRLYFLNNPNVIQSEVFIKKTSEIKREFDLLRLAFEYHKHLAAGIIGLGFCDANHSSSPAAGETKKSLVIGLGGGGLINFLHSLLPKTTITTVELDGNIVKIARSLFGFNDQKESIRVILGDGLNVCCAPDESLEEGKNDEGKILFAPSSLTSIVIDVDSKDNSSGMSCPPVSFTSIAYLTQLKELLTADGVLAINVSARDPEMLKLVKLHALQVFPSVFISSNTSDEEDAEGSRDDLNVVVFAKKEKHSLPSDKLEFEKMIGTLCDEGGVKNTTVRSELEECLIGVREIKIEDITPSETEQEMGSTVDKKPANKKAGKKKGPNKKKKGKKK